MFFGAFNRDAFNVLPLDGSLESTEIASLPEEVILSCAQIVGVSIVEENIVVIEQQIDLQISIPEETILSAAQSVTCQLPLETIVVASQKIISTASETFLGRNGWSLSLVIAGMEIPHDRIYGNIVVTFEANQSNLCDFTLLVSDPVTFIDDVWGQSITLDYYTGTNSYRQFTGLIDIPEIDLVNKRVKFKCSNRRDELVNNTMQSSVKLLGRYSEEVFGKYNSPIEELNLRIQTTASNVDFDSSNVLNISSWYVKPVADFSYTASNVYHRKPSLKWQSRSKIINDVNINLAYQYTRLYHYQRNWAWRAPFADSFCEFLLKQYSLLNIQMVNDAVSGAGWKKIGNIQFESVWSPGTCVSGLIMYIWQGANPFSTAGVYKTIFDDAGNVISDPSGKNLYGFKPFKKSDDLSKIFTLGAQWTSAKRFSQYVKENYSIKVKAQQSVDQFGDVPAYETTNVLYDYDAREWENYAQLTAVPSDAIEQNGNYFTNKDINRSALINAQLTLIDKAKTKILDTHRDTQVDFEVYLEPTLQLKHTVSVTSDRLTTKGRVSKIVNTFDVENGKDPHSSVTLSLFRSKGTATTSTTAPIAKPVDSIYLPADTINLPSTYGVEPTEATTGYIGNKNNPSRVSLFPLTITTTRTEIQEEFRVDTPVIPDTLRSLRNLYATDTVLEVFIPNDLLEVSFD